MAAGKELFKLFGLIGMQGVETTKKEIRAIDKQVRKAQKEFDRLGRKVQNVGKVLTKAFTVPLLIAGAATLKFIDDASDLNETIAKTGEIFGESAKDIEDWASSSSTKIGQSKDQAMDAAATFAIFGKSAGLAGQDLTKFSTEFVELASDMASFFNTDPAQAITAIGAAFRGENEPIRKYGILLDDATMRQKAFEMGLITTTKKALLPQTKVLAAQALIIEQSKIAQGDFARTASGLANQKRILAAQIKNVSASLGQIFLPAALAAGKAISKLVGIAERLVEAWKALSPATKNTIKGFLVIAAVIGPVVFIVGKLIFWAKVLVPLLALLKAGTLSWAGAMAVLNGSVGVIVGLIAALVALGWYWFANWDTLKIQIQAIWESIRLAIFSATSAIVISISDMVIKAMSILAKLGDLIPGIADKMKQATIAILKFQGALYKEEGRQMRLTNGLLEQGKATNSLSDSIKKVTDSIKKSLGFKDETIKKTQIQIDQEKEQVRLAKEKAKKLAAFDKDILDQIQKLGADKVQLLEIERLKAVAEAEKLGADVQAVRDLYASKAKELEAEARAERAELDDANRAKLDEMLLSKLELLELEKEAELLKADEIGASKFEILGLYALKEADLKDTIRKEAAKKDKKAILDQLANVTSFGNKINGVLSKFSDNKLQRLDNEEKRKIEGIENSQLTEEAKEEAIAKVQEEMEKKRRVAERERAKREKLAALFNIAINTASAVVEALPNIPLAAFIGGIGLAEGIAVATSPLPFFEGGLVEGSNKGVNALVGEDNQDEIVFPLEKGIGLMIDGLIERLGSLELPSLAPPALAGAAGGASEVHLHIGTFIGDERGLKELERKLDTVRIAENQRKGI